MSEIVLKKISQVNSANFENYKILIPNTQLITINSLFFKMTNNKENLMKGGLSNLMKQAQQIQENFQKAQEELTNLEVTGEAGGGMVKILMTGRHDVRRVNIEPSLLNEDREMLEDLVAAAINDAVRKVEAQTQEKMAGMANGLSLPGGMKLPF